MKPADFKEFVAIMALSMSLVALAIDSMLPALSQIADSLDVTIDNDRQLVVTVLFVGLAIGQIFYGPISDSIGRRGPIYVGFGIFILGSLIATVANSYWLLLFGRFLQGLGAAGPRIITVAIIRDRSSGREMARLMSLVMMVFILVPAIAPALGQIILYFSHWRMIFMALVVLATFTLIWFHLRQPETLDKSRRQGFSLGGLWRATIEICTTRVVVIYTLAAGLIFGAFIGFLNSSQQILQEYYGLGEQFPFYFAALALTIGGASWANSRAGDLVGDAVSVQNCAMVYHALIHAIRLYCLTAAPSLIATMTYLMITFFATGILLGNFNSLAMEPVGHIAGLASSLIGSITTFVSVSLGYVIGNLYNVTVIPMVGGFAVLSFISLLLVLFVTENDKSERTRVRKNAHSTPGCAIARNYQVTLLTESFYALKCDAATGEVDARGYTARARGGAWLRLVVQGT